METKKNWEKIVKRMELLMRLKSFPVGFKMLEKKEELDAIPFMRRPEAKVSLCQLITQVRSNDWTVGADLDNFLSPLCPSIIGLTELPSEGFMDGTFRSIVWTKTRKDGAKYEQGIPRMPVGKYEAVAMAPLVYNPFEPDIVLIYANPSQMMLLINALQFEDYEVMQFFSVGESSCSDAIARCYLTGKPSMTIPCYGERRYGHAQDEDLVMALPAEKMEKALAGLEVLYRRGIRYPISYAGAESDLSSAYPGSYGQMSQLEVIRGTDSRLLIGVTGSIATGKSTVASMLEELGAPIIDFDVLAHEVVEPDLPAWKDIVAFFGEQILQEDRSLDRQRLSDIVFNDMVKRKKLESFIHPRIQEKFILQLLEITQKDPEAIVQVVIPLLIELNLQYLFDNLLVVHIPQEMQVKRLSKRDGITEETALNILQSQISIDEKVGYAEYVVHNDKTVAETRKQVEKLWQTLKEAQKAKKDSKLAS
ncbi:MAG: dephospho-CoA kinase [Deltaproteobacteria bacterium]|jgi:dephospho-CoA kinase|nr:dephospho-CoA kinase [Deltaproteobacteria bacterium]MBT4263771.1 dephospho-CoA kinase [Deltaproteobacteria bacterium]MBT6616006.1 dephospho-CoA kinase [Deltaproteobacteria bacterium]MBT7714387.1 dephospho-CoA kinase [Deltaproteobacteria bacterium]MBT7887451.1 dephospho-CoA kinase [Deltaproteobacteria bacterium]